MKNLDMTVLRAEDFIEREIQPASENLGLTFLRYNQESRVKLPEIEVEEVDTIYLTQVA